MKSTSFEPSDMEHRILLVEDEEHLLDVIKLNLELEGYAVIPVTNGSDALEKFRNSRFELIIIDVMLPGMDGFAVCESIRLENKTVPVLFLTAKDGAQNKIHGLKIGGDDYLTKPFNLEELLLRIRILLRRGVPQMEKQALKEYQVGKCKINFLNYELTDIRGNAKQLSKREIRLLRLLIEHKNEVVSREEILKKVWGYDVYPSTRTIDNYILAFRKYFEENPKAPRFFHSVRGVGYKFTPGG